MKKMIKILLGIFLFSLTISTFGQHETDKLHNKFVKYLKIEKIDSIYNSSLKKDENSEQALLYRNQFGWALNKVEQLKKDIPAILKLPTHSSEMAYLKIFRPQKFPPTEWNIFYEISIELEKHFESNPIVSKEILAIKTKLEFLTRKDKALLIDLPKLLEKLNNNSSAYFAMLNQYGNLLIRNNEKTKAQKVFEKGLQLNSDEYFLLGLIQLHSNNKNYEKVISYEQQILSDSSGIMLYNLAEAQMKNNNRKKADKYFRLLISKFKYTDYEPYVQLEYNNFSYSLQPFQLETLGDFYFKIEKQLAYEFYEKALKILSNTNDIFFKKQLMAIQDETEKKKMIEKFEKNKIEQQELLNRINNKLKKNK